jgi:hypothetical protein
MKCYTVIVILLKNARCVFHKQKVIIVIHPVF